MNKQIVVLGLLIAVTGAYLFSMSSVTVLSEFDVIPTTSFITYYAEVDKAPLPFADYRLELTNNNKEGGLPIDLYVFDDENYDMFKRCGGSREGADFCKSWETILTQMELTGTYKRALDPNMEKVTVVVWNHNMEETLDNSISIRMESNYSGLANVVVIAGLLVFYIGLSRKAEKIQSKKIKSKDAKE